MRPLPYPLGRSHRRGSRGPTHRQYRARVIHLGDCARDAHGRVSLCRHPGIRAPALL